jgi:hypothetical protein
MRGHPWHDDTFLVSVCDDLPDILEDICQYNEDCSEISCCTDLLLQQGTNGVKNALLQVQISCDGKMQYGIENKIWTKTLSNFPGKFRSCP